LTGPLTGYSFIEIAGLGPAPFCAMMLADMGATVVRVDRASRVRTVADRSASPDVLNRGRRSVGVDLKHPRGAEVVLRMAEASDGLIEGFRPGVAERLGIGPEPALARNQRLVYGRMTGWGQTGPRATQAGHDIDYIALSGVLGAVGPRNANPVPPLNLVGDFGGGGMLLAFGLLAALLEAQKSGRGQVVDAAMIDGSALLSTMQYAMKHGGLWDGERGDNLLDGGAPFYSTYRTKDDHFIAVGALEPQFFADLLTGLGLEAAVVGDQYARAGWPQMRRVFADRFQDRTQAEWVSAFDGLDACIAPVLDFDTAHEDPHNMERQTFLEVEGFRQPAPAPRFVRTPAAIPDRAYLPGSHTDEVLAAWGWSGDELKALRMEGAIR